MGAPMWMLLLGFLLLVLLCVKPLGLYMARVFAGEGGMMRRGAALEGWIYRACGIDAQRETPWRSYAAGLLLFNVAGALGSTCCSAARGGCCRSIRRSSRRPRPTPPSTPR